MAHVTFLGGFEGIRQLGLWSVPPLEGDDLSLAVLETGLSLYRRQPREISLTSGAKALLWEQMRRWKNGEGVYGAMSESDWIALQNQRVLLFPVGHHRVAQLVFAHTSRGEAQEVIHFDTLRLLEPYEELIEVATVNRRALGATKGSTRNREAFLPLAALPRRDLSKVQEVSVKGWLPLPEGSVRRAFRHLPSGGSEDMWPREERSA